jgi:hypothetical protein
MSPHYACRKIFTQEQENTLVDYILNCSKMCYGQTIKNIKQIAYEIARLNNIPVPKNWKQKKEAGHEWFLGFMARNPNLSIRQPEACSLTRITSFNRHNVDIFFNNLENIYNRYDALADGTRIYSVEITYGINSVILKLMIFAENAETGQFLILIMLILSYITCS